MADGPGDLAHLLTTLDENELATSRAERVQLLSLHAAKGLEFEVVFICGLEEGLLPYTLASSPSDPAEERRLLYVGMTRARQRLYLTHARRRTIFGRRMECSPSGFLAEIESRLTSAKRGRRKAGPKRHKPVQKRLL